jgi:tetratricopeptide (TPR) repeat protein
MRYGSRADAIAGFEAVLEVAPRAGWSEGEAAAHGLLGNIERVAGKPQEALRRMTRSAELFAELRSTNGEAGSLGNLGLVLRELGRVADAVAVHRRALALYREMRSVRGEAMGLGNLAESLLDLGEVEQAGVLLDAALVLHERAGDRAGTAESLRIRATVRRDAGDSAGALADAQAALDLVRRAGDRYGEAVALSTLASVYAVDDGARAVEVYGQALAVAAETGDAYTAVQSTVGLAAAYAQVGDADAAAGQARDALRRARDHGYLALADAAQRLVAADGAAGAA